MEIQDFARRLAAVAVAAADPEKLVREELTRRLGQMSGARFGAILALGKAAAGLARGTRGVLSSPARRLLIRPHSSPALLDPGWEQLAGGHPLPDRQSLAAGDRAVRWLGQLAPDQALLALLSGGASACVEVPAPGITLEDLAATQRALLASGLPIQAVNAVRKHLSSFKGGGALRTASAGRVLALLLSDVPGDDPSTLASGPFAADPTTFAEALAAVEGVGLPEAVRRHLEAGARGVVPETVKPGDPALVRVETVVVGGNGTAVAAVLAEARRNGFTAVDGPLEGEAARTARVLVARGRALGHGENGVALVLGGETTVTLTGGTGRGGRNGELALAAARELAAAPPEAGAREVVLALATDGEDGPTRWAGAVVDGGTWEAVRRAGKDPRAALERHDSYGALSAVPGSLLETGPTGTNVADLAVYLRMPDAP
ncbi:MAG TPA: DUF4147 domain-containing protein [Thermoanaerobaculia bacterium]|nr:DUF4147 domain-containing protein [Thermoanaerobaculia bacterium]